MAKHPPPPCSGNDGAYGEIAGLLGQFPFVDQRDIKKFRPLKKRDALKVKRSAYAAQLKYMRDNEARWFSKD
eukprot:8506325-Lingulodinium_polyedra.AAC.1